MNIITLIKNERDDRKVSQQAISAASGIPQPMISLIENGRLLPTSAQRLRLARVFNLDPDDLLKQVVIRDAR